MHPHSRMHFSGVGHKLPLYCKRVRYETFQKEVGKDTRQSFEVRLGMGNKELRPLIDKQLDMLHFYLMLRSINHEPSSLLSSFNTVPSTSAPRILSTLSSLRMTLLCTGTHYRRMPYTFDFHCSNWCNAIIVFHYTIFSSPCDGWYLTPSSI